jgi:hypothetical protein
MLFRDNDPTHLDLEGAATGGAECDQIGVNNDEYDSTLSDLHYAAAMRFFDQMLGNLSVSMDKNIMTVRGTYRRPVDYVNYTFVVDERIDTPA